MEPMASTAGKSPSPAGWNFVARHWRGELPLWISYWVVNFCVGVVSAAVAAVVVTAFRADAGYEPMSIFATFAVLWSAIFAISVWQIVGLWRSANRHIGERAATGLRSPWARLAKFAAILMTLNVGVTFARDAVPQLKETTRIAFMGDPDIPAYSLRVMRNGTEAEISGGFKYGLTGDFSRLLKENPGIKVVHLHSGGGRIGEAKKLYSVINENGLTTYVSVDCASACTLAFAGGKERYISVKGSLGFHAPSFPGMTAENMKGSIAEQSKLFIKADFAPAFVSRALNTPSSTLWRPGGEELLRAKAITGVSDNARFAASGYGGNVGKDRFDPLLVNTLPLFKSVRTKFPDRYDAILTGVYESYVNGESDREQLAKIRQKLLALLAELRPQADDDVVVDFGRLQLDSYKYLAGPSATLCYEYASGVVTDRDFTKYLSAELLKRERDLNERIVATARPRAAVSEDELKPIFARMFKMPGATMLTTEERDIAKAAAVPAAKHGVYCQATVKFFTAMLLLPQADAAKAIRAILKN